jgi:hypothetical protein
MSNTSSTTRCGTATGRQWRGHCEQPSAFELNSRVYRITARTFELTERGHLTDRYSKAIEQLGNDTLDVRLGGISRPAESYCSSDDPQPKARVMGQRLGHYGTLAAC